MRFTWAVLFLLSLFVGHWTQASAPRKVVYLIGAAEPGNPDTTLFDNDLIVAARTFVHNGYEVYSFVNGLSKTTVEKSINIFKKYPNFKWQPADTKSTLESLRQLTLTEKDKLVLFWIGHGSPESQSKKHGVMMNGGELLRIEDMQPILDSPALSKAAQVFIDGSCYSGHSLIMSSSNRCVMTSSSAETLGYYNFPRAITDSIENAFDCIFCSRDPLSLFIKARSKTILSNSMISSFKQDSPAIKALHKITRYYLTIEEYLYYAPKTSFCNDCYYRSFKAYDKELQDAFETFKKQETTLPPYVFYNLISLTEEFIELQRAISAAAFNTRTMEGKALKDINILLKRSHTLYNKLLQQERFLYNTSLAKDKDSKAQDPCRSFKF